jgi:hypothetical protein
MAGEGSTFHMISALKNNKALLRKKNFFMLRSEYLSAARKIKIDIKTADPAELKKIRQELIYHNKRQRMKKIAALLIAVFASQVVIWSAIFFGQWMFS